MTFSLTDVDARTALLRGFEGVDLAGVPRAELVKLLKSAGEAKGAMDRLVAVIAGEVQRRSSVEDGAGGLARVEGFGSAPQMVASMIGATPAEGHQLVRAGTALREDRPVASALKAGLSVSKADLVARTVTALEGDTTDLEERLTRVAQRQDYRTLKLVCDREAAKFDTANLEAAERRHCEQRTLEITERAGGQVHIEGNLPATQGAILITFLDAQVKAAFHAKKAHDKHGLPVDERTATQIRADALTALAAHGLDCTSPATGVKATIILRIDAKELDNPDTLATCDALNTPLSLNAFHQLTMDATIMRMVMNAKSHVLDCGHEQRLFNWAQRMALAERDGGCATCHAPLSHCIAHHIIPWQHGGRTDLTNGATRQSVLDASSPPCGVHRTLLGSGHGPLPNCRIWT